LALKTLHSFKQGSHRTKKYANSYQFSQFRNYTPGDDVRLIDWKVYGRTQKLYIKQSTAEQQITISFIPDLSASMLYEEASISKINYSKYIFACLTNLAFQQGDAVQLFHKKPCNSIMDAITGLSNIKAANYWLDYQKLYNKSLSSKSKNLVIYCSDFYEYNQEMMAWLSSAVKRGNEVIAFHLTGQQEKQMSFHKNTVLIDLETNETQRLDRTIIQQGRENFIGQQKYIKQQLSDLSIHYWEIEINEPVKNALIQYLNFRKNFYH